MARKHILPHIAKHIILPFTNIQTNLLMSQMVGKQNSQKAYIYAPIMKTRLIARVISTLLPTAISSQYI